MKTKILSNLLLVNSLILLSLFFSCGSDDCPTGPGDPVCNGNLFCAEPTVSNSNLELTFLGQQLDAPVARYTVLFKADLGGEPLVDLQTEDVMVEDRGTILEFESQNALIPDPQSFGFHILLLADLSGSITESNTLPQVLEGMRGFVESVLPQNSTPNGDILISVYYFDGDPDIVPLVSFTNDRNLLISTINGINESLTRDDATNLFGAFVSGAEVIAQQTNSSDRLANVGSMVVFTDGTDLASLSNMTDAQNSVDELSSNSNPIDVFTIGLGQGIEENVLRNLGTSGFFFAENLASLIPTFQEIGNQLFLEVNSFYELEYCSPRRNGDTNLDVIVTRGNSVASISSCINSSCTPDDCR